MSDDMLVFNGLDGSSGNYLAKTMSLTSFRDRAFLLNKGKFNPWENKEHINSLIKRNEQSQPMYGLRADIDPNNLAEAGWGMIFPTDAPQKHVNKILEALSDLVVLRKSQTGDLFKIFYHNPLGYILGETGDKFSTRHGIQPGSVDPKNIPYYLLIVADPQSIPFSFQYQLDIKFAVGRIYFENLVDYANYAQSICIAEQDDLRVSLPRKAVFFGVSNQDDEATKLSTETLIQPLYEYVSSDQNKPKAKLDWAADLVKPENTYKNNLLSYLGGTRTPALLFTASHGLGWPYGDKRQYPFQGALVCQDWPGPIEWKDELLRTHYLAAEDISSDANLLGTVAFFFACYGAGTPYWDDYAIAKNQNRAALAHRSFLAALPKRLLSLPKGGALAVIGHVERAWGCSFRWGEKDARPTAFEDFLFNAMNGRPIGFALESLNDRYGQIAAQLNDELIELKYNQQLDPYNVSYLWIANNDARSYAILGDPAIRIPVSKIGSDEKKRPSIIGKKNGTEKLPVVLVKDSVPENEMPNIEAQASATFGKHTPNPPEEPKHTEKSNYAAEPEVIPPEQKVIGNYPQFQRSEVTYRTPMDGLAMSLQAYTTNDVSFGIDDDIKTLIKPVVENLFNALKTTSQKLQEAVIQATTLEISTMVVDELNNFSPTGSGDEGNKRFLTRISLTGDVQLYLPKDAEAMDEILIELHKDMVQQAHTNRMEMIKTLAEMIASLYGVGS